MPTVNDEEHAVNTFQSDMALDNETMPRFDDARFTCTFTFVYMTNEEMREENLRTNTHEAGNWRASRPLCPPVFPRDEA